jgi:hypothetical protein
MRLFKIRENATEIFFSADGSQVAAPSDLEDQISIQKLVLNSRGKLPPESQIALPSRARFLGWHSHSALCVLLPADAKAPRRIVAKNLAGRGETLLARIEARELGDEIVVDS